MTNFLTKTFIKNSEDLKNPSVRESYGKLSGVVGIIANLILFVAKISVGAIFKSIAIVADAINNLSDAGSSIITLIGFKLSGKPADEKHPYGHARIEYITGLIISFLIMILGLQLFKTSLEKIFKPDPIMFSFVTVLVLIGSIAVKLWLSIFNKKIGKKINSTTIIATSSDSLNDVFATSAVLVSTIFGKISGIQIDGYMGLVVSGFIVYSGIKLIGETLNPLLGLAPDNDLVEMIENKIKSYDGVIGLHDLVVHNYGPNRCFASVHVEFSAKQDILISHDIIDNIERDFITEKNINLVIHLDPIVTDDEYANSMKDFISNYVETIDPKLSIHDFRTVIGTSHNNLIFDITVPPLFKISDKELRTMISEYVSTEHNNCYCVITIDRSYVSSVPHNE